MVSAGFAQGIHSMKEEPTVRKALAVATMVETRTAQTGTVRREPERARCRQRKAHSQEWLCYVSSERVDHFGDHAVQVFILPT